MGKQHFGCKIKMSVRFGRPAKLLARTAMMVVVVSLSGKVVGHLSQNLLILIMFDSCSNLESPADFTAVAGCL